MKKKVCGGPKHSPTSPRNSQADITKRILIMYDLKPHPVEIKNLCPSWHKKSMPTTGTPPSSRPDLELISIPASYYHVWFHVSFLNVSPFALKVSNHWYCKNTYYWKCNFPMNCYVHLIVGLFVGWSFGWSSKFPKGPGGFTCIPLLVHLE